MNRKTMGWLIEISLGAVLFAALFLALKRYWFIPFTDNEGAFLYIGQEMIRGARLYQDVWDHKPPLLFDISFLLQKIMPFDEDRLHGFAFLIHLLNALLLTRLARHLGLDRGGAWVTAFFYVALILPPLFQTWAMEADLLMLPFLLLSLNAAFSNKAWGPMACGFWWVAAFFTKQSGVFFLPLFLVLGLFKERIQTIRWILGAALAFILVVFPFWLQGGLGAFWAANVGFNQAYVESGWNFFWNVARFRAFEVRWVGLAGLTYGIPLLSLVFLFRPKPESTMDNLLRRLVTIWMICALVVCCVSGYFFAYYFLALLPPLALSLGYGFMKWRDSRKVLKSVYFCLLFLGAAVLWTNLFSIRDSLFKMAQYPTDRYVADKELGLTIRRMAQPQDRLLAWACDPQVYVYAGLRGALKTPFINHLKSMPTEWMEAQKVFLLAPPRFCVVNRSDQVLPVPDWLDQALQTRYQKIKSEAELDLYVLSTGKR